MSSPLSKALTQVQTAISNVSVIGTTSKYGTVKKDAEKSLKQLESMKKKLLKAKSMKANFKKGGDKKKEKGGKKKTLKKRK
jgi:hypothetical protein